MAQPRPDDIVIRRKRGGNPSTVYVLGTSSTPDQYILPTRDEAVAHALACARRAHVRAWFDNGDHTFVLLGTFSTEAGSAGAGGGEISS